MVLLGLPACHGSKAVAPSDVAGIRVLFIGNSLTRGVPELVEAVAASQGVPVHAHAETGAGFSLSDHWNAGQAAKTLADGRWDYVVLQQGPSTLPESQRDLKAWAARWAEEARQREAKPALYMVWPYRDQPERFRLVSRSYRAAASAAHAMVLPAGEAWQEALRRGPKMRLYGDELHAAPAGLYLTALVIARGLFDVRPRSVRAKLPLRSGAIFAIPEEEAALLRDCAEAVYLSPAAPTKLPTSMQKAAQK